ncbi:hypothetical protein C3B78_15305 [Arthrobacter sp. PGP41]|uniref:hypothetical protein n=1 Tax=Arthrobacter sp. PGP41 TaxID=2079227 RepID=UPI000CDC2C4C|nr:hypothetical protein [Arthrobacter sp. PGP41]AUZ35678.1 hypothetical protein C3B78_15305 [Arthrobacter sp. PGP41]
MNGRTFTYCVRVWTAFTGATAAAAVLGMSPSPAQAAEPELLLSADGVTYSRSLARPIFGEITGFVPGSSSSADVWVYNGTNRTAFLSIAALGHEPGAALTADLGLAIRSNLGSTARMALGGSGSCSDLAAGWALEPAESVRLTFKLDLARDSSNATRRQSSGFDVRFMLEDQDGATRGGACSSGGGTIAPGLAAPAPLPASSAPLAVTGAPQPWGWFLAAAGLVTAGSGILVYMRRNKASADD